jgi:hypothetical protein
MKTYTGITIYLDDLEAIHGVFASMSKKILIESDGNEYEDFKEFFDHVVEKGKVDEVKISSTFPDPHVNVEFAKREARVYASQEGLGALHLIDKIIERRVQKPLQFFQRALPMNLYLAVCWILQFGYRPVVSKFPNVEQVVLVGLVAAWVIYGLWVITFFYAVHRNYKNAVVLLPLRFAYRKNLLTRNRDLVVAAIGAVIGTVIGAFALILFEKIVG